MAKNNLFIVIIFPAITGVLANAGNECDELQGFVTNGNIGQGIYANEHVVCEDHYFCYRNPSQMNDRKNIKQATLGAGCFWCVEAIFKSIEGVEDVEAGYSGGSTENPSYEEVCSGITGHAEVARIRFDPTRISFSELLEIFWHTHDPTTLNRQGNDRGTQYRSIIFYHDEDQKKTAEMMIGEVNESGLWKGNVVTKIEPLTNYYKAENYHQDFFNRNPEQAYCSAVIQPKMDKLRQQFSSKLRNSI